MHSGEIRGAFSYILQQDEAKDVRVSKTKIQRITEINFSAFGNNDITSIIKKAKEEKIVNNKVKGIFIHNLLVKITGIQPSTGQGIGGIQRPDKISGFVMDQNGKALAHGIFATWSFRGDGIQQLTNNMILLLPLVQFKRSLYHPKGIDPKKDQIYLDANVAFTMFDAAVLKVMFLSLF